MLILFITLSLLIIGGGFTLVSSMLPRGTRRNY